MKPSTFKNRNRAGDRGLRLLAVLCLLPVGPRGADAQPSDPESTYLQRIIPSEYRLPVYESRSWTRQGITVTAYAQSFAQGYAVYVELLAAGMAESDPAGTQLLFEGAEVPLTVFPWGARGLFALGPEQEPGQTNLTLLVNREQGPARYDLALEIAATSFPESTQRLELGVYSNVDHAADPRVQTRIREGARRRSAVLAEHSPDRLSWALAHPRDKHVITSPFWAIRIYHRYQVQEGRTVALPSNRRIHRGLDLRGRQGDPVFAIADGQVVLAEELHYEGKLTIIDHGHRVFSFYMHQDEIVVSPGQMVTGGTLIGRVGSTGQSTAPHLHVSLTINGVHVDPLSLLVLPIRR